MFGHTEIKTHDDDATLAHFSSLDVFKYLVWDDADGISTEN